MASLMGLWPFWQPSLILFPFVVLIAYQYFERNKDACLLAFVETLFKTSPHLYIVTAPTLRSAIPIVLYFKL